jgi:hypothetical protein
VKDGASGFQKFNLNFHKFYALFPRRFSQFGYAITSFAQYGSKMLVVRTKAKQWLPSALTFYIVMKFSITSYEQQAMKHGFNLLMLKPRAVKAVDAHIFTVGAKTL